MIDFVGIASICLVTLSVIFITYVNPIVAKFFFVGFIIRLSLLFIGYFIELPDSSADAETFEVLAWYQSQKGFFGTLNDFQGPHARFISWLIAIPYSLFGRSLLMAQSISLVFGMGSILLGWALAKRVWNIEIANKVAWTMVFFPSLVLYSILTMREVYVVFFVILAMYGVVDWVKTDRFYSIIIAMMGFVGATFFHGAMFVGSVTFFLIVSMSILKKFFCKFINNKIDLSAVILIFIFLIIAWYYLSNKVQIPYLGAFKDSVDLDYVLYTSNVAVRGDASFPEWLKLNSLQELFYKTPIRSLYVIYAPFPWDVTKTRHLIGMFDGFLYMYLTYLIFKNRDLIWKDISLRIIFIILLSYIFIFGVGVGNFGGSIRHRSKFVFLFILLAAPYILKIKNFNKLFKK